VRATLLTALLLGSSGCIDGCVRGYDPAADAPDLGTMSPAGAAQYVRGSLTPLFRLTPRSEYGRLSHGGVTLRDRDYQADAVTTSIAGRLDDLGKQLAQERGLSKPVDLLPDPADRERAAGMPFRGHPSDVKVVNAFGVIRAYVPLGGDVSAPGNEVVVVDDSGVSRLTVGLRPQRLAVHDSGLVFVCNQYSNYISIIEGTTVLPFEVQTDYHCADLVFRGDRLYVANRFRHAVLAYDLTFTFDPMTNKVIGVTQGPEKQIDGVGHNPFRLALSPGRDRIYVANNRGGELAWIHLSTDNAGGLIATHAPTADVLAVADLVLVPTTMPDRGLLSAVEQHPPDVLAAPLDVAGLDGQVHRAHPGAQFDHTRSYGFEDVRSGLHQLDPDLAKEPVYYTDDVSPEANFAAPQKVLAGALPQAIARSRNGSYVYVALGGSDLVQELVVGGERPFALIPTRTFATGKRPFAVAVDDDNHRLLVANWGGESLDRFDLDTGAKIDTLGLGYGQPAYPATTIEQGEMFFFSAAWSNNGRKSCASCHFDELDTDGLGFSNGTIAPTALHQVKPTHDLAQTGGYYWNGSFVAADYASLEFAALTRTNCEIVELGLVEGPGSNPAARIGDPRNRYTDGQDATCRPQAQSGVLANQAAIDAVIADEKKVRDAAILQATGLDSDSLSRALDFYAVSELRLPPNPLAQRAAAGQLDATTRARLDRGRVLFDQAGCSLCHDPARGYTDNAVHGTGAGWLRQFIDTYGNDPRVTAAIGALPQPMLDTVGSERIDRELTPYIDPLDAFVPFCFDLSSCMRFLDPLAVKTSDPNEETRRLDLLMKVNLADPQRGFIPGNVPGQPRIDTPSLRAVWTQPSLLHHALAHSIAESILAPGHPAGSGFAVDAKGAFDVHGATSKLSPDDVKALEMWVESLE
jgi:DNA-binding beta-propeller fold protein YncE